MRVSLILFLLNSLKSMDPDDLQHIRELFQALRKRDYVEARELTFAFLQQIRFDGEKIDL